MLQAAWNRARSRALARLLLLLGTALEWAVCLMSAEAAERSWGVQEDADTMEQLAGDKEGAEREAAEIRRQMEEDADEEIEELKNGCACGAQFLHALMERQDIHLLQMYIPLLAGHGRILRL